MYIILYSITDLWIRRWKYWVAPFASYREMNFCPRQNIFKTLYIYITRNDSRNQIFNACQKPIFLEQTPIISLNWLIKTVLNCVFVRHDWPREQMRTIDCVLKTISNYWVATFVIVFVKKLILKILQKYFFSAD